jgi:DNA-binding transcriptional ArsR family regulator
VKTNISPIEALSDPTRRKLFEQLRNSPCSVSELVQAVPVSQPAVSQHLRVLRQAHLVTVRKQGQQRIYSIDQRGLAELRDYIDSFWDAVLDAFQGAVDKSAREETNNR